MSCSCGSSRGKTDDIAPDFSGDAVWFTKESSGSKPADLFYVHPTTEMGMFSWNIGLTSYSSPGVIQDNTSGDPDLLKSQAGPFECCNKWAPRYRQVGMVGLIWVNLHDADDDAAAPFISAMRLAIADVTAAFQHFLSARPDKQRPFIIAGHSQGAIVLTKVMKDCLEGTPHEKMFVAAYLAGGYVPRDLFGPVFKSIHEMSSPSDIGCIASWDTRISDLFDVNSVHNIGMGKGMWCHQLYWFLFDKYCERPTGLDDQSKARVQINPLTWSAKAGGDHFGAFRPGQNEAVLPPQNYGKSVKVTDKAIWVEDPRPWLDNVGPAAGTGNLHPVDVQFWFFNIRDNAAKRVQAFLELRKQGQI